MSFPFADIHDIWAESAGAAFLGVLFSTFVCGIISLQAFIYFNRRYLDPLWMQLMVALIWFLELLHMILYWVSTYQALIVYFGDYVRQLTNDIWSFKVVAIITPIIVFITQAFLAYRAWRLDKSKTIFISAIALTALVQVVAGLYETAGIWTRATFFDELWSRESKIIGGIWFSSATLCDALITASLVTTLMKSRTGFDRMDSLISWLIKYIVNTGILTCIWSLIGLVLFLTENNLIHTLFTIVATRFYFNTLMGILNSRKPPVDSDPETLTKDTRLLAHSRGNSVATSMVDEAKYGPPMQPNRVIIDIRANRVLDISPEPSSATRPLPSVPSRT